MIFNYFISFCRANRIKIAILILSISLYFALSVSLLTLNNSLPEVASLPFKKIGVQTIVQRSGLIPEQMSGVIFPHSNGPLYPDDVEKLDKLDFVESADSGLYFWYFGDVYKNVFGVTENGPVFSDLLKQNIEEGYFSLSGHNILITKDFAQKNHLTLGAKINFDQEPFTVSAILRTNLSGNIIPADVYMSLSDSQDLAARSPEMQKAYKFMNKNFVNVVALNINPNWRGDIEATIKGLNKDYLIFSEKTFSRQVADQVKLISSLGKIIFISLGFVMIIIFSLLTVYNFKTRAKEIAVLRMIGWSIKDLKRQFITESAVLLIAALVIGNILGAVTLIFLSRQQVTMELPWELSARPHFLPQENAINRIITANLPVHYDPLLFIALSFGFFLIFGIIYYLSFRRIKNIKPSNYLK
jgi:ABC-type antimicrobial peptide transport system permease subunit